MPATAGGRAERLTGSVGVGGGCGGATGAGGAGAAAAGGAIAEEAGAAWRRRAAEEAREGRGIPTNESEQQTKPYMAPSTQNETIKHLPNVKCLLLDKGRNLTTERFHI